MEADFEPSEVAVAKIINKKPYVLLPAVRNPNTQVQMPQLTNKPPRVYTFDISKAEAIFDKLLADKLIKLPLGHKIPSPEEMKGKEYCKYHNLWNHTTNNCVILRNDIQDKIERGEFKFQEKEKKAMGVDANPFPAGLSTNMVSANMRGMPKSAPRTKISLGTPSRESMKVDYWDFDEEDFRSER